MSSFLFECAADMSNVAKWQSANSVSKGQERVLTLLQSSTTLTALNSKGCYFGEMSAWGGKLLWCVHVVCSSLQKSSVCFCTLFVEEFVFFYDTEMQFRNKIFKKLRNLLHIWDFFLFFFCYLCILAGGLVSFEQVELLFVSPPRTFSNDDRVSNN